MPRKPRFNLHTFLNTAGLDRKIVQYRKKEIIFSQGAKSATVFYIREGRVKLTVVSENAREAIIGVLGDGDFLGEGCLAAQLFNPNEKRLARTLLLLARYGKKGKSETIVPKISGETLAEIVGTTRSRVSFFMNRFRKLGYNAQLCVHSSLLNVVLVD